MFRGTLHTLDDYLARNPVAQPASSLRALEPEAFPEGNERLSRQIDAIVYGDGRS